MANKHSKKSMTVEDFGLQRVPATPFTADEVAFGQPYFDPHAPDWQAHWVCVPEKGRRVDHWHRLNTYAVSLSQKAYVVLNIQTTSAEYIDAPRLTDMRAYEMLIDNMRAASGGNDNALKTLRWIAGDMIISDVATKAISAVFQRAGTSFANLDVVEVTPDDAPRFAACFERNPLTRGVHSLLEKHAGDMGGAFVKRFTFMARHSDPFGDPILSMIVELDRPTTPSKPAP